MQRAAELRRLGNFSRNAVLGRARMDTCQRTVSVTVPGKRAERPQPAAPSRSRAGGGARSGGEHKRSVRPGDQVRVGVWVAGWTGAQCLLDAGTGQGLSPGRRDCRPVEGTGSRGQERGVGAGLRSAAGSAGQTGTRRPLAAGEAAASPAQGRGCLPKGLGGPAVLTAAVSLKPVTSFLLAGSLKLGLSRVQIKRAVCRVSFTTRVLSHTLWKCFLGKRGP